MNKKHNNTIESYGHTIKLDNNTWQDIKTFFLGNYAEHSILVTNGQGETQKFADFDSAGLYIIEADRSVRTIGLSAHNGEENIKIDFTHGIFSKQPTMRAEVNHNGENEKKINKFLADLKEGGKPQNIGLYNYYLLAVYLLMLLHSTFKWFNSMDITLFTLVIIVPMIIIAAAYSEGAWGFKKIIFWLDENKKNEEIKMAKRIRAVLFVSYAVTFLYFVGKIFF